MCIQDISWSSTHHSLILVKNANVWGISKYHDFFVKGKLKWRIAKNKIKLSFGMHPLRINTVPKHLHEVM
jgi:hypothetical protein